MKKLGFVLILAGLLLSACAPGVTATAPAAPTSAAAATATPAPAPTNAAPVTLNVMVHDSFAISDNLVQQFEQQNNVKLNFLKSGDAGTMLNRAILTRSAPQADVMYGVDNTFLSRALASGLYDAYASPLLKNIPAALKLDPENRALPVDSGDVCINYDKAYFADKKLAVPQTLEDLARPEYQGLLVMENPATSSPGLAFVMATIAHFGQDQYLNYWKSLRANGLVVVNDWETAYYTNFSGSTGKGSQPMVVSYNSSPAAEVVFAKTPPTDAPTASLVGPDMCFRQIEFVGILKGAKNRALAEKWVDFMLDKPFQEDMPLQMFVYPVNGQAALPPEFLKYAKVPDKPVSLDPAQIDANRDKWIEDWKSTVLN